MKRILMAAIAALLPVYAMAAGLQPAPLVILPGTITANLCAPNVCNGGGGAPGTVTNFSAGSATGLFSTSVTNPTTTPSLSFNLTQVSANQFWGGASAGGSGAPGYRFLTEGDIPSIGSAHIYLTTPLFSQSTQDGFNSTIAGDVYQFVSTAHQVAVTPGTGTQTFSLDFPLQFNANTSGGIPTGVTSPVAQYVCQDSANCTWDTDVFAGSARYLGRRWDGTDGSQSAVGAAAVGAGLAVRSFDGTNMPAADEAAFQLLTTQLQTTSNHGHGWQIVVTQNNTTTQHTAVTGYSTGGVAFNTSAGAAPTGGDPGAGGINTAGPHQQNGVAILPPTCQCYLSKSGSNLLLAPYNGNNINIAGAPTAIPNAGVTLATTGLSASTYYYIYAFLSSGTLTLEASTTVNATNSTYGYEQKSGDSSRTLVGAAYTTAGTAWADTATTRFVASYFNQQLKRCINGFSTNRTTTSATFAEINSEIECQFILPPVPASSNATFAYQWKVNSSMSNGTASDGCWAAAAFNSTTANEQQIVEELGTSTFPAAPGGVVMTLTAGGTGGTSGLQYMTMLGKIQTGGTCTYSSTTTIEIDLLQ